MKKRIGYLLIGLILFIEIPRFFGAYDSIDPRLFGIPLTAIGTGIVLPIGAGYILHTWWKTAYNKKGRDSLLIWFAVLLLLEGIILIPWGMSRLQNEPINVVTGNGLLAWFWIGVVMLSPFVLTGGIVTAIALERQPKQAKHQIEQHIYVDEQSDHVQCGVCNRIFTWPGDYADERTARRALAGHMNKHRAKGDTP